MSALRSKLQETHGEHVLQAAQHSVYILAAQHHAAVVSSLLGSPLPFDRCVVPTSLRGGRGSSRLGSTFRGHSHPLHGSQETPALDWVDRLTLGLCWPVLRAGSLEGVHHHL